MGSNKRFAVLIGAISVTAPVLRSAQADVTITPSVGYRVTWDGNEGDFHTVANPANAPANLSTAAGASAFASGTLGVGPHVSPDLVRNGTYGNLSSWIGSDAPTPVYVGIDLGGTFDLNAIAWSRDNGVNNLNGDGPGSFGDGQYADRALGTYTVQVTNELDPATATSWTTVGTLTYNSDGDSIIGADFSSYYRHQYGLGKSGGAALLATGVRLIVPAGGLAGGTAIDELELYGASPVTQTGLRSWTRGDGDVTLAGPSITQVGDHSGNGNHATPGNSPTVGTINGLGAASFNGAVQHLNVPVLDEIDNSDYEIFVVARSSSSAVQFIHGGAGGGGVGAYELHLNSLPFGTGARFIPSQTATGSPDTYADLGVHGMFTDGRAHLFNTRVEGGTGYLRVVGMENGDTVADAASTFVDGVLNRLTVGVRGDGSYSFVGEMGETLIYNRALSAEERREVERYLARKWNAPLNVASQTQGGVAFANQVFGGVHQIDHLNNALYGNAESWLGLNSGGGGGFAGVKFDDAYDISSIAFGRAANNSNQDRWDGIYTFQFTRDHFDPLTPETATWQTFLVLDYINDAPAFPWLRHQYDLASQIGGVLGVRVLLSSDHIAIDELEIYGLATVPTPTAASMMVLAGLCGLAVRRRRNG